MKKKLLLMVGGVFLALVVGEIAARVVLPLLPDPPDTPFIGDAACMYRLRPTEPGRFHDNHDEHINYHGFRDRNYPQHKPAGSYRVLGLGDSFVYGAVPIQENFLRVAERTVNENAAVRTDILLMGVPGWSTENELGVLEDFGLGLEPDLVLVNFFVGNDVTGLPVRCRVIRGNAYPTTSPLPVRNLLRKSQLFLMLESLVMRGVMRKFKGGAADEPDEGAAAGPVPVSDVYLKIARQNLPVFLKNPDPRTAALWTEAEGYLKRIDEVCRAAGVSWMLVLIPDETQVDPAVRAQVLTGLGAPAWAYDFDGPQKRLQALADQAGVPVLDLLPVLRAAHRPEARLYQPNDTHWNAEGNLVAGRALAGAISELRSQGSGY
jgi:hypothetical protein